MLVALDRGTPLADVLRAQAHDARAEERQRLMESAGRRDVAMLVPIVFLVLPSVVLIAAFPAIRALEVVVP
jgi:tight adherence protein C